MDRRFHLGLLVHLPADVDLEAGIRRVRTWNRPSQMFLSTSLALFIIFTITTMYFIYYLLLLVTLSITMQLSLLHCQKDYLLIILIMIFVSF